MKTTRIVNLEENKEYGHLFTNDERLAILKLRMSRQRNHSLETNFVHENAEDRIFYYGEKGTYERLLEQGTYDYINIRQQGFKKMTLHWESQAFKDLFKYVRWNAEHRCVLCKSHFTLLSDFLHHCLVNGLCSKQIKIGKMFHCPPCKVAFEQPNHFIMHMIKEDYHGTGTVCNIPKIDSNSYRKLFETFQKNGELHVSCKYNTFMG